MEDDPEPAQRTLHRVKRRDAKKRRRMPVAGKSVFVLNVLLRARTNARRAVWRRKRRKR